ncbi:MAG: carboxypeptidase-like regulatory domain-containing protein, partial [Bacteroidales bacterium]|nr:carboxypeptidase-like regulatory domain-containing protein [Bacteroidales bacterium]
MNKRLLWFCLLLGMVLSLPLFPQVYGQGKATLEGRVTDEHGKGIDFVAVGVVNLANPIGTTTDADGRYTLEVPGGMDLKVSFSHTAYDDLD